MKYLSIVMFLFCLHVSLAVINATDIFSTTVTPQNSWFDDIDDNRLADEEYVQSQVDTDVSFGFGDFVKGIYYFVKALGWGILSVPYTLQIFGMQSPFIYYFSLPIYIIYFIAIAQFISNRATKSMG